jgi:hypothetical protein
MKVSILIGILLVVFSACTEPESSSALLQKQLDTNRALWLSVKPSHYKFDYVFVSDAPYTGPLYTVEVENNIILSVFNHETNALMDPSTFPDFQVIDNLFDVIQKGITQKANGLTVTYNQDKGYPEFILVDMKEILGDEVKITTSSLVSL